jgi:tRNA dimethylallyltransferase
MLKAGFVDEVKALRAGGFRDSIPLRGAAGYREISGYLDGEYDLEEAVRRTKNAHHRLVRRQAAWFRDSDPRIHWIHAGENVPKEAVEAVREWLARGSLLTDESVSFGI